MTDEQTPTSGNRWESACDASDHETAETGSSEATSSLLPPEPIVQRRSLRDRVRPAVAGVVAGAAVVAGLGGFAVGRATSGDDGGRGTDQQQVGFVPGQDGPPGRDGVGRGFDGDGGFPADPSGQQQAPPGQDGTGTDDSGSTT